MEDDRELHKLIDRYLDEGLSEQETEELNDLLESSRQFRDFFRQKVVLHAGLVAHYDAREISGLPSFKPSKKAKITPFKFVSYLATAAVLVLGFIIITSKEVIKQPEVLAQISFSDKAVWQSDPGELLTEGQYRLAEGMVELQLPNEVNLAIEGPAEFSLINAMKMQLERGKISANVGPKGRGFEVLTPDGKIVDLGTRFGVWVADSGTTEAHVFKGEINVMTQDKKIHVIENESVNLEKIDKPKTAADRSFFPMPGFKLALDLNNADFEETFLLHAWPTVPGIWGGDHCEIIPSFDKITPASGKHMLRFVKAHLKHEEENNHLKSQMWQLIDLSLFSDQVNLGSLHARVSGMVNQISGLQETEFNISIIAFKGNPAYAKNYWDRKKDPLSELMALSNSTLRADNDEQTWQPLTCQFEVPSGTDYLLVQLVAGDGVKGELAGHFMDDIQFEIFSQPRRSKPIANWLGKEGDFFTHKLWKSGKKPDLSREQISIMGEGEVRINKKIVVKQDFIIAKGNESQGYVRITKDGSLHKSRYSELLIGYNRGGRASLIVEGELNTAGKSLIGRNNESSQVVIDGGRWQAPSGSIRMSQYGGKDLPTQSSLRLTNGGSLLVKLLRMIHDHSQFVIDNGSAVIETLQIGGSNGVARVKLNSGQLQVDRLIFGPLRSSFDFSGSGILLLKGEWTSQKLRGMTNANWLKKGETLEKDQLKFQIQKVGDMTYTAISLN